MGNDATSASTTDNVDFGAIQQSESFQRLRKTHRNFVFPVLIACLVWYLAYVLLAGYAKDFMSTPVFGTINIALLLGLAQVVTTFVVTMWYVSFANKQLDPQATAIREAIETGKAVR